MAAGAVAALVVMVVLMAVGSGPEVAASASGDTVGLDPIALDAYRRAAATPGIAEGCEVRWPILAAIGQIESGNAAGRVIDRDGNVTPPIIGVPLDGQAGTRAIADTDGGIWDADRVWDRAVGPFQFIASSWRAFGRDANEDSIADPHNLYDAALAATAHLCLTAPGDYTDPAALGAALRRYNRSDAYVTSVQAWVAHYDALADADPAVVGVPPVGGYALPIDRAWFEANPTWLRAPHHDYPAADIPVPSGTPVYAASAGRVRAVSGPGTRCGLGVVVAGIDGWDYVYCHASIILVQSGDVVAAGQTLLLSGNTGESTGPHLHFGVQTPAGLRICPQPLLEAWYAGGPDRPTTEPTTVCTW